MEEQDFNEPLRTAYNALEEAKEAASNIIAQPVIKRHILSLVAELRTAYNRIEAAQDDILHIEQIKEELELYEAKREEITDEILKLHEEMEQLSEEKINISLHREIL